MCTVQYIVAEHFNALRARAFVVAAPNPVHLANGPSLLLSCCARWLCRHTQARKQVKCVGCMDGRLPKRHQAAAELHLSSQVASMRARLSVEKMAGCPWARGEELGN